MADEKHDLPRPFDVQTVEYLLKLMSEHDLYEVDLKEGDQRIRLRRGSPAPSGFISSPFPHSTAAPTQTPGPAPAVSSPPPPPSPPAAPAKKYFEIKSELVGSFYSRPHPDKPEFVKVGSRVSPETTVCLIIAMKVNNEIKAGCSGTIVEIAAKNEDFVDFGSVLFRVDTDS